MEIVFFTSNRTKTQHAQYLCRHFDIKITNFREKTYHANYDEPRIQDREKLLLSSYKSALEKARSAGLGINIPFIIEDTSVIIESLSNNEKEYPGTDIKYWMRGTRFEDIDFQLLFGGNNRNVKVRSDLIFHCPQISKTPLRYTSESTGTIVEVENKNLKTNTLYPWLDNKTFNRWFCPKGESCSVSELPIEIADKYDFRKESFETMLKALENRKLIQRKDAIKTNRSFQQDFSDNSTCHIVTGLSCAGKTTIAEYLADRHSFLHIEASDFMHLIYLEMHGEKSEVELGKFAKDLLEERPIEVAKRVLDFLEQYNWKKIVITGFRKAEEVDYILENCMSGSFHLVWVNASSNIRLQRKESRNRNSHQENIEKFEERDKRERSMGLDAIANRINIRYINNEIDFESYYEEYSSKLLKNHNSEHFDAVFQLNIESLKLKDLVALTLYKYKGSGESSPFFNTTDICKKLNDTFHQLNKPKHRENIGRLLNKKFDVFFEVKLDTSNKRKIFRLSNTGVGHAKLLLKRYSYNINQ